MRNIFTNLFSSSSRNNGVAASSGNTSNAARGGISAPAPTPAIARAAPSSQARQPANATPYVEQNYVHVPNISLQNLRLGNEPDSSLVNIPMRRHVSLPDLTPPHDEQTSGLSGTQYFEKLGTDTRLPSAMRVLCAGRKLAQNALLSDRQLESHTEKLRFIASRCHSGSEELKNAINEMALEAQVFCGDRTEYFVEQMHGLAVLDLLTGSDVTDEAKLFNLGVAFYKLNMVKSETCKRMANAIDQRETVEDVLTAEYLLQDDLGLPLRHIRPSFIGSGNMTPAIANEIKETILSRLISKDGVYVIDFLSDWQPWSKYIEGLERNQPDFDKLRDLFAENLATIMNNPDYPESVQIAHAEEVMDKHREWKREVVGQKSREYLINYRANLLFERGITPGFFLRGAN